MSLPRPSGLKAPSKIGKPTGLPQPKSAIPSAEKAKSKAFCAWMLRMETCCVLLYHIMFLCAILVYAINYYVDIIVLGLEWISLFIILY